VADSILPEDGETRICSVPLAAGARRYSQDGQPVAWVTAEPVTDAGRMWLALSDAQPDSGLVPVLLDAAAASNEGGGPDLGRLSPAELSWLDDLNAADVLTESWQTRRPPAESEDSSGELAPFGRDFPGLAPATTERLSMAELQQVLLALPPSFVGLVAASRSADVPAVLGWGPSAADQSASSRSVQISVVLRSWEARFGARLLQLGPAVSLRLLIERPPRSIEAVSQVAAEHYAFCDQRAEGASDIADISAGLVGAPIWTCGWD
jgi:Domain of unknown function (DUF4253)